MARLAVALGRRTAAYDRAIMCARCGSVVRRGAVFGGVLAAGLATCTTAPDGRDVLWPPPVPASLASVPRLARSLSPDGAPPVYRMRLVEEDTMRPLPGA